jgi:hypothetical protein
MVTPQGALFKASPTSPADLVLGSRMRLSALISNGSNAAAKDNAKHAQLRRRAQRVNATPSILIST